MWIICQSYNSSLEITKGILETSLVTLIDWCKKRIYYKDRKLTEFTDRIENISVVDIVKQNGFYHRKCYQTFWNLNEVKRTEKHFNCLNNDKQYVQMLDRNVCRPSKTMGFSMPPHPLTNFEIQKYQNEQRFNGVFSRNNLPKKI